MNVFSDRFYRNLNFVKESFYVKFKKMFEYKINTYSGLLINFFWILAQMLILRIMYVNFGDMIGWSFEEYCFFIVFFNLFYTITGMFWYGCNLSAYLTGGILNDYLMRPLNVFLQYFMNSQVFFISSAAFIYFLVFLSFVFLFFDSIVFLRLFLVIPFCLLAVIFEVLVFRFLDSIAFFMKRNNYLLGLVSNMNVTFTKFPALMFRGSWIWSLAQFVPNTYYTIYSISFLFGKLDYYSFYMMHLYLLVFCLVLGLGIYLFWRFGLERYEAFS